MKIENDLSFHIGSISLEGENTDTIQRNKNVEYTLKGGPSTDQNNSYEGSLYIPFLRDNTPRFG